MRANSVLRRDRAGLARDREDRFLRSEGASESAARKQMVDIVHYNGETGKDWKRVAQGFRLIALDNTDKTSHLPDFLAEPGARVVYRNADVTIVDRGSLD